MALHLRKKNRQMKFPEGPEGVKWELGFAIFRGWEMGFYYIHTYVN